MPLIILRRQKQAYPWEFEAGLVYKINSKENKTKQDKKQKQLNK